MYVYIQNTMESIHILRLSEIPSGEKVSKHTPIPRVISSFAYSTVFQQKRF